MWADRRFSKSKLVYVSIAAWLYSECLYKWLYRNMFEGIRWTYGVGCRMKTLSISS